MPTVTGLATSFITFSRPGASGGGATVTDRDGRIKWAGHNLLLASESFDNSYWIKAATTVTANAIAAPNGTTTADAIFETTANAVHYIDALSGSAAIVGATYTRSVFLKANGRQWVAINFYDNASNITWFDIQNGVVGTNAAGTTASITAIGSGWFLCSVTRTAAATPIYGAVQSTTADNVSGAFAGDVTKGFYAWGAHLYRSDLGGMQQNPAMGAGMQSYYPTTPRNLVGYSEDFNSWTKSGTTVTSNTVIAPNGLQTADTVNVTGGAAAAFLQTMPSASGLYTLSIYAKAGSKSVIQFSANANAWGVDARANFNLATGALGTVDASLTAAITPIGDGWYRCSVLRTKSATAGALIWCVVDDATAVREATATAGTLHVWGAQLSDSASLDTYVPQYGAAVTSAAYYAPRLDFDPVTLAAKGLLVEEARTNLLTFSNDFTNAAYALDGTGTLTANDASSPAGTQTATKWVPSTSNVSHYIYRNMTRAINTDYAFSIFAKYAGARWLCIRSGNFAKSNSNFFVDLLNRVPGSAASDWANVAVTPLADGWMRITGKWNEASIGNEIAMFLTDGDKGNTQASGLACAFNGTDAAYIYGIQIEQGSFSTSMIVTGSATATRAADVASVSTQAFPYSGTAGSWVAYVDFTSTPATAARIIGTDGGSLVAPLFASSTTQAGSWNGAVSLTASGGNLVTGAKAAVAYDSTGRSLVMAGGTVATDANTFPAAGVAYLGSTGTASFMSGHIRQITYLPRRLTSSELQSRTA